MAKTILASSAAALVFAGLSSAAVPARAADPVPAAPEGAAPAQPDPSAPAPANDAASSPAPAEPPPAAAPPEPEAPAWETAPSTRRAGFAVGVLLTGGIGNITGYPADVAKRDRPEFRTDTGVTPAGSATVWLGGALTDWLVFGAGLNGARAQGNGTIVQGFTFVFHTEVFPLFFMDGAFRDLGVSFDTGAGNFLGEIEDKPSGDAGRFVAPVIDSGAASRFCAGLFYDGLRISKLSGGPYIAFDYTWSATLTQPLLLLGFRGALYTKALKPGQTHPSTAAKR